MEQKGYAVIVDGYSSGNLLAKEFKSQAYQCLHVQSTKEIWPLLKGTYHPEDYEAHFAFEGQIDRLVSTLKPFHPHCVVPGTETGVELADSLSEALGCPGNGTLLSAARRNKYLMIEAVRAAGLLAAKQIKSETVKEIIDWKNASDLSKIVLKPIKSAGTDSVSICSTDDEIRPGFDRIFGKVNQLGLKNEEVLAQEFLQGTEYAIDMVSFKGQPHCSAIWKYHKVKINNHHFVYDRDELIESTTEEAIRLQDYAAQVLKALKVQQGPSHLEIMLTERGPAIVEMGARLNGVTTPRLHKECIGYGQLELTIDSYVNHAGFEKKSRSPYRLKKYASSVSLISEQEGIVDSVPGIRDIERLPSCNEIRMRAKPGYQLQRTIDYFTSPGFVMLVHPDKDQVERDLLALRAIERQSLYELLP